MLQIDALDGRVGGDGRGGPRRRSGVVAGWGGGVGSVGAGEMVRLSAAEAAELWEFLAGAAGGGGAGAVGGECGSGGDEAKSCVPAAAGTPCAVNAGRVRKPNR